MERKAMSEAESNAVENDELVSLDEQEEIEQGEGEIEDPQTVAATEEVEQESEEQKRVQEAFAKKQARIAKERKEREAAEAEASRLREELEKFKKPGPVDVPPEPDRWDDDYEVKLAAWKDALQRNADYAAQRRFEEQQKQRAQEDAQRRAAEEEQKRVDEYAQRGEQAGIKREELFKAGQVLLDHEVSAELAGFLLEDDDGPRLTTYLAKNPMELEKLNSMSPMKAVLEIERTVRKAAKAPKVKKSEVPDPATRVDGGGAGEKNPLLKGATFV